MHSAAVLNNLLTPNEVSSILNLICPHCGGPIGGLSKELRCEGLCCIDWRPAWDSTSMKANAKRMRRSCNRKRPSY